MRYYTTSHLSENRRRTPEGYLLCIGVPIARTGLMEYLPEELPENFAESANKRSVRIRRADADVFSPEAMASFEGKPVTIGHPDGFVTPDNWKRLSKGISVNVRRGAGKESDLLLADLLLTDQEAIARVESGELREISCGYDAEYEELEPGSGRQSNIVGNHVALVPQGRCGTRCTIKDEEPRMTKPEKAPGFWDRLLGNPGLKRAMDEAAAEAAAIPPAVPGNKEEGGRRQQPATPFSPDEPGDRTQENLADTIEARLDAILAAVRELKKNLPGGCPDEADDQDATPQEEEEHAPGQEEGNGAAASGTNIKGSAQETADRAVLRRAGLLAPSMRFQARDSACRVKRLALQSAMADASLAGIVTEVVKNCLRGQSLARADSLTLDAAFIAASEILRLRNNSRTGSGLTGSGSARDEKAGADSGNARITPAQINEQNRKYRDSLNGKRSSE